MPNARPKTLEDLAFMLATYVVEQNRDLLNEVLEVLRGHTERLDHQATQMEQIMATQEELEAKVTQANTQLDEVVSLVSELRDEVVALQEQIDNGQQVDLTNLDALVNRIAVIVPDPEPTPEP